jgi:hypothetical protein
MKERTSVPRVSLGLPLAEKEERKEEQIDPNVMPVNKRRRSEMRQDLFPGVACANRYNPKKQTDL